MISATWLTQITQTLAIPFRWWVIVAPWEQGLRIRGGKRAKLLRAGIHLRIPYWDRVYIQATRLRSMQVCGQTVTTRDGKVLTTSLAIEFAVSDIEAVYNHVSNPDSMVMFRVESAVTEFVATHDSSEVTPATIERAVNARDNPFPGWGLESIRVRVTCFAFTKTYRLMMHEYNTRSGLENLEAPESQR